MIKKIYIFIVLNIFLFTGSIVKAELTNAQKKELFEQGNEYFQKANSAEDRQKAKEFYEKAILSFNRIIDEGNVRNAKLYYNLANTYFLNGDIGRAILNYRRAETLDSSDENIKKNLAFARSKRMDVIDVNTEKRVLQTLFFWHYDFAIKTKFALTCIFFAILFICATVSIRLGINGPLLVGIIVCGLLTICFLSSVIIESNTQNSRSYGVIISQEVVARQGDGQNYPPSFTESLHEGTEFEVIENRTMWYHIKLSDGSDGWIPSEAAEII